jgi:hypothetical protein
MAICPYFLLTFPQENRFHPPGGRISTITSFREEASNLNEQIELEFVMNNLVYVPFRKTSCARYAASWKQGTICGCYSVTVRPGGNVDSPQNSPLQTQGLVVGRKISEVATVIAVTAVPGPGPWLKHRKCCQCAGRFHTDSDPESRNQYIYVDTDYFQLEKAIICNYWNCCRTVSGPAQPGSCLTRTRRDSEGPLNRT